MARAAAVQSQGEPGKTVQPRIKSTRAMAGTRLRRRLSRSFQRSRSGSGFVRHRLAVGTRRPSQGKSCQSPRTQRCSRRRIRAITGREIVEKLGVAEQAAPRVVSLDQVMAQNTWFSGNVAPVAASNASTS